MGIFKRKTSEPSTGHKGDDQTLAQLKKTGADFDTPRAWEHFVYCDDEAGAAILEQRAREGGWDVERVDPEYHGIVAKRSDLAVNPGTVTETRAFFENLAASVAGGDYDGWGAEA